MTGYTNVGGQMIASDSPAGRVASGLGYGTPSAVPNAAPSGNYVISYPSGKQGGGMIYQGVSERTPIGGGAIEYGLPSGWVSKEAVQQIPQKEVGGMNVLQINVPTPTLAQTQAVTGLTPAQAEYVKQYEKVVTVNPADPMGYYKAVAYQPGRPALNIETLGQTGYATVPGYREQVIGNIISQQLTPAQIASLERNPPVLWSSPSKETLDVIGKGIGISQGIGLNVLKSGNWMGITEEKKEPTRTAVTSNIFNMGKTYGRTDIGTRQDIFTPYLFPESKETTLTSAKSIPAFESVLFKPEPSIFTAEHWGTAAFETGKTAVAGIALMPIAVPLTIIQAPQIFGEATSLFGKVKEGTVRFGAKEFGFTAGTIIAVGVAGDVWTPVIKPIMERITVTESTAPRMTGIVMKGVSTEKGIEYTSVIEGSATSRTYIPIFGKQITIGRGTAEVSATQVAEVRTEPYGEMWNVMAKSTGEVRAGTKITPFNEIAGATGLKFENIPQYTSKGISPYTISFGKLAETPEILLRPAEVSELGYSPALMIQKGQRYMGTFGAVETPKSFDISVGILKETGTEVTPFGTIKYYQHIAESTPNIVSGQNFRVIDWTAKGGEEVWTGGTSLQKFGGGGTALKIGEVATKESASQSIAAASMNLRMGEWGSLAYNVLGIIPKEEVKVNTAYRAGVTLIPKEVVLTAPMQIPETSQLPVMKIGSITEQLPKSMFGTVEMTSPKSLQFNITKQIPLMETSTKELPFEIMKETPLEMMRITPLEETMTPQLTKQVPLEGTLNVPIFATPFMPPSPPIKGGIEDIFSVPKSKLWRRGKLKSGRGEPNPLADIFSVQRTQSRFGGRATQLPLSGRTLQKWTKAAGEGFGRGFPTAEIAAGKVRKGKFSIFGKKKRRR